MSNEPTPRTDAELFISRGMGIVPTLPKEAVRAAVSRQLERELTEVTKQRDRLAEALKEIYNVSSFDYDTMPELARKKYREVVLGMADEALQSITPKAEP